MFKPPQPDQFPTGFLSAMGYIVALWSSLEAETRHCLMTWLPYQGQDFHTLLAQTDMRARLATLKAVAFGRMEARDFETCEGWINAIENDLRNYRNRLVHDQWHPSGGLSRALQANRLTPNRKITRDPGSGNRTLLKGGATPVTVAELNLFADDLMDAWTFIAHIPAYSRERGFADGMPQLTLRHKSPPPNPLLNPNEGQTQNTPAPEPEASQE